MADTQTAPWRFDKDYRNRAQIVPFFADYMAVYDELTAAGKYPYNDSFVARIPGIAGPDEDSAIYMLQTERALREVEAKVAAALAEGCEPLTEASDTPTRYSRIIEYGWYMGGTGWREWEDARLVIVGTADTIVGIGDSDELRRRTIGVIPKGKRTRGHIIAGRILVRR